MKKSPLRIHGLGCGLGDVIFGNISFNSPGAGKYMATSSTALGFRPGALVFLEDLLSLSVTDSKSMLTEITGGCEIDAFNVGGPALVSLVLSSQLLTAFGVDVKYFGLSGDDAIADNIREILSKTPLHLNAYQKVSGRSPSTYVLSDPSWNNGHGERSFINDLGVCAEFDATEIPEGFFDATLCLFGGTALLPKIHENLETLLKKAREKGAITVVGTVYDFIAEKKNPKQGWGLGPEHPYPFIDLLICDREEALKISATTDIEAASGWFLQQGCLAVVVTQGPEAVYFCSEGGPFGQCAGLVEPPEALKFRIRNRSENPGDTTGAGDNFLGALSANLMMQLLDGRYELNNSAQVDREQFHMNPLSLGEAVRFASVAGALACIQYGGTHIEVRPGERLEEIRAFVG